MRATYFVQHFRPGDQEPRDEIHFDNFDGAWTYASRLRVKLEDGWFIRLHLPAKATNAEHAQVEAAGWAGT